MAGPTGVPSYSTTAATNAAFDGGSGNWAENQAPSTVNNTARLQAADLRNFANDLVWFAYGNGDQASGSTYLGTPALYSSATAFTVAGGVDVTSVYHANRRVKAVGVSTGTIYGSISSSSYSAPTNTINVTWDSGSLSNETIAVYLSQVPVTGAPIAGGAVTGPITTTGLITAAGFSPTSSTATGNRFYLSAANVPAISANSVLATAFDQFGAHLGLGTLPSNTVFSYVSAANTVIPGTASTTAASKTVTGVSTLFTKWFMRGDPIKIGGETQYVDAIASDTSLTTVTAWTGTFTAQAVTAVTGQTPFQFAPSGAIGIFLDPAASSAVRIGKAFIETLNNTVALSISNTQANTQASSASSTFGLTITNAIAAANTQNFTNAGGATGILLNTQVSISAAGTIANVNGIWFNNLVWGNQSASATVTNATGILMQPPAVTGTVTNARGIKIEKFTGATNNSQIILGTGTTGNWGIYDDTTYNWYSAGASLLVAGATAIPAGGTAGTGYLFSSTTNFGVFFGSGAPSLAAAKGSLYCRSDGSSTSTRMYVNTDGSTTWTNVTTAA